jgi:methylthioribose-1-phosphate isomerase
MSRLKTIEWVNDAARIIDQTKLPNDLVYLDIRTAEEMYDAIKILSIRGAPAIGIAAAFGVYCGIRDFPDQGSITDFLKFVENKSEYIASSRPTAVNLFWAVNRMKAKASSMKNATVKDIKPALLDEALTILEEDKTTCRKIGENGFEILKGFDTLLTHCNAGGLATSEYGTALAPIYVGKERGKVFNVYADETRPLLQGARITSYELLAAGIPVTLICDNMAAAVMAMNRIDAVIVGADRIASNGDTANKIGTYGLALIAKAHNVPFFVAAPFSTFDLSIESGKQIPIEQRSANEIINGFGKPTAPSNVPVFNPAFDVTPHELITAIITERGVLYPPFERSINESLIINPQ